MASRKGSLLERNVELVLKLSGFNPVLNKTLRGYEIDVFLKYKNLRIAFECKQYERSTLAIRNLIHQWDSKNKELKFDKIVLVLIGCNVSKKDSLLAKKYGILIWDEQKLTRLLDKAIEQKVENKEAILRELGIKLDDTKKGKKTIKIDKNKVVKTKQQTVIKEAVDKLLKEGVRSDEDSLGGGFVIFEDKTTGFYVQYALNDAGLMLNLQQLPKSGDIKEITREHLDRIVRLLNSMKFTIENEIEYFELNETEMHYKDIKDIVLIGAIRDGKNIDAQCGEDPAFIAYLTDRILREVFNSDENYKVETQLELDG